jgi:hypothetical protein
MIGSVVTYACPVWEFPADTYLLNLQCLENKVLRITGNFQGTHSSANCTRLSTFRVYMMV